MQGDSDDHRQSLEELLDRVRFTNRHDYVAECVCGHYMYGVVLGAILIALEKPLNKCSVRALTRSRLTVPCVRILGAMQNNIELLRAPM